MTVQNRTWKLSIPNPCEQDWKQMTPDDQGRYCAHCAKTVTDLSRLSDTALVYLLESKKGEFCGRLRKDQLDRVLIAGKGNSMPALSGIALTVIAASLLWPGQALTQEQYTQVEQIDTLKNALAVKDSANGSEYLVEGRVLEEETGEALIGARVTVPGTTIRTISDIEGRFKFTVRDSDLKGDSLEIQVALLSVDTLLVTFTRDQFGKELTLEMPVFSDETIMLIGGVVAEPTLKSRLRRFWYRCFHWR